jgi:cytochrome b subunit of formate dehydrogenase
VVEQHDEQPRHPFRAQAPDNGGGRLGTIQASLPPGGNGTVSTLVMTLPFGPALDRKGSRSFQVFCLALLLGWALAPAATAGPPNPQTANQRCQNCHGQGHIATLSSEERRTMVALQADLVSTSPVGPNATDKAAAGPSLQVRPQLYIADGLFVGGVHAKTACTDCHQDALTLPHPAKLGPASCATAACHAREGERYQQGAHRAAAAGKDTRAPTCTTCHGGHDIVTKSDRSSRVHPLNILRLCADCHQQQQTPTPGGRNTREFVQSYLDSVHGRALQTGGLTVVATCASCHDGHLVLPAKNPNSSINRQHISQTCGQCHTGVTEAYQASVHGQQAAKGDPKAPVCVDCHSAHAVTRADSPAFMLDIVNQCGHCHDKPTADGSRRTSFYETYRQSYHGQVTNLGSTRAARCSDCHGAHNIRRIEDPASSLSAQNRIETCRHCHPGAPAKLAQFQSHADHRDAKRYPLLHAVWWYFVVVMSCSFGFFSLHSLLWLLRSAIERFKHGPPLHAAPSARAVRRFNRVDRANHALGIASFFGLALTGLPLFYADKAWARALADLLGGVRAAGLLHRVCAVVLIINFAVHGLGLLGRLRQHGLRGMLFGPTSMLPKLRDLTDCLGMMRWFFVGGKKPTFECWAYWEKFDYVADLGGSAIIGISGLLLWFPQFFSLLLPGWAFNVAMLVHGYEALLAIGFIFTIHFFNAHLRLEKFPVDDAIFTGRIPEAEFKHERGDEYARLLREGSLEERYVPLAPTWYRRAAIIVGIVAMVIGMTLVVLIILAGLGVV